MLHCDFVYVGESAKFQMPFINLRRDAGFGTTSSVPVLVAYLRAAELILLGLPFDAVRAAELGFVTRVVPDENLLETATGLRSSWLRTSRTASSLQETHEAIFPPADRAGDENRERGIPRTGPIATPAAPSSTTRK